MSDAPPRPLRIVIPGGTGHLGTLLARYFHSQNHSVTVISRFPAARPWQAVHWNPPELGEWIGALEGADALVNLASHKVASSLLADAIAKCTHPPRLWLDARSIDSEDDIGNAGRITLRIAPVMSPDPRSSFAGLLRLVRFALLGRAGSGLQYVCWIHALDFVRAIEFLIVHGHSQNSIYLCSPQPLPSEEFLAELRLAWNPLQLAFAYPEWLLEASAFVLRANPRPILEDCRVMPGGLLESGFDFAFPEWSAAALDLVSRWREIRR